VTGMRLGEARNLELQDVDLTEAILTIWIASTTMAARATTMMSGRRG
jgi:integrase